MSAATGRGGSARLWRALAGTLAGLVIAAALFLGALRLGLALVPDHPARIQGWIERQTGLRLEFASLDARLRWWGPEAVLREVRVLDRDATQALFSTREATVSVDVWSLFRTGELVAGRVRFVGPAVTVVRLPDGRIRLLGQSERPAERPPFDFDRLPAGRLEIVDATVRYEDRKAARGPWLLQDVSLALRRAEEAVDVAGRARLPETLGSTVEFGGRLRGSLDDLQALDVGFELEAQRVELAGLADFVPAGAVQPLGGGGPVRLSLQATRGRLRELSLEVNLGGVEIGLPRRSVPPVVAVEFSAPYREPGASPLSMPVADRAFVERPAAPLPATAHYAAIAGRFTLGQAGDAWTFGARDLVLRREAAETGPPANLGGRWRGHPASAFALELQLGNLRAADLWPLVLAAAPPALDRWAGLDPEGEVSELDLALERERAGSEPRFRVSGAVSGLGVRPTGRWPGFSGITAHFSGTEQRGRLALRATSPSVEWPRLFRAPLELERADADIDWRRDGAAWVLASGQAALAHAAASAQGSIELRLERGGVSPHLTVDATVQRFDVATLPAFLPVGRLMPRTVVWFDQAFERGELVEGRFRYRGPVRRFPFRAGEGEMHATADVRGVRLSYLPGFAPLVDGAGTVEFHNAATRAQLREGSVAGLRLSGATFGIADYRDAVMEVEATGSGDLGRALGFVQASPLGPRLGEQFMGLSGQGATDFVFDLRYPTQRPEARDWKVRTRLKSATVRWSVLRAPVTRLAGDLEIGERAVRAKELRGSYLDGPFQLSVRPAATSAGVAMSLRLEGSGRASGPPLSRVIGLPEAIRMAGTAQWRLTGRVDRPAAAGRHWPVRFEVASDLAGLGIDAPRPFAKGPADPRDTRVVFDMPGPARNDLRIESGAARALLEFARRPDQRWVVERGAARFDGRTPARPARPGLHVAGDWPEFDLGEWLALRSPGSGGPRLMDWLGPVDVHLDRATVSGFEFLDVTARMQSLEDAWRIQVSGPTAEGVVRIPADLASGAPVDLDMERLALRSRPAAPAAGPARETDPRDLPALTVRARDFTWEGRRFGRLEADLRRDPRGLRLERLASESGEFAVRASGTWFAGEQGSRTQLEVGFSTGDLAAASRALGYRDAVDAEGVRATARVGWTGGPDRDVIARLDGTVRLELGRGRLRGVEPGAGRILGLMSIGELPRRLSLDFRDVTEAGLAFDRVSGDFEVRAGSAYTKNLLLQGPAVDVGVVGRTGLAAQDYDQTVVVSGNPSGPITLAGALAGGPVGAAGALLISQLFKGQLKGLARVYYRVSGPWSNPVVERISASTGGLAASPPAGEPSP